MEEFDYIHNNGRDMTERTLAHIRYMKIELLLDLDRINSSTQREREKEIDRMLYSLDEIDKKDSAIQPTQFDLFNAYPNPFNSSVRLTYEMSEEKQASLCIFDLSGRLVATPVDGVIKVGEHSVNWDASSMPSGIYMCRLSAGSKVKTSKLALVK